MIVLSYIAGSIALSTSTGTQWQLGHRYGMSHVETRTTHSERTFQKSVVEPRSLISSPAVANKVMAIAKPSSKATDHGIKAGKFDKKAIIPFESGPVPSVAAIKSGNTKGKEQKRSLEDKADPKCSGKLQRRGQCMSRPATGETPSRGHRRSQRRVLREGRSAVQGTGRPWVFGETNVKPRRGTFHVQNSNQSPPDSIPPAATGIFEVHGPSKVTTEFSDPSYKHYTVPIGQKKTVYVSDENHFHTVIASTPPGKHVAMLKGARIKMTPMDTDGKTTAVARGPSGTKEIVTQGKEIPSTLYVSSKDRLRAGTVARPGVPPSMRAETEGQVVNTYSVASGKGKAKWRTDP